jgi:hypothetical protein
LHSVFFSTSAILFFLVYACTCIKWNKRISKNVWFIPAIIYKKKSQFNSNCEWSKFVSWISAEWCPLGTFPTIETLGTFRGVTFAPEFVDICVCVKNVCETENDVMCMWESDMTWCVMLLLSHSCVRSNKEINKKS